MHLPASSQSLLYRLRINGLMLCMAKGGVENALLTLPGRWKFRRPWQNRFPTWQNITLSYQMTVPVLQPAVAM